MARAKRPTNLAKVRRNLQQGRQELAAHVALMDTIGGLDTRDQYPLFWKMRNLEWRAAQLERDEKRLIDSESEREWTTVDDSPLLKIVKTA